MTDSYGAGSADMFSVAGRRAEEGVAAVRAAGEGVAAAVDTMLAGAMTWLPGDQAGERRGRRRVMDHSAWMPIDKPVR